MPRFRLGVLIGVIVGLAIAAALAIWMLHDPIPPLARPEYEAAVARWRARNVVDYDLHMVFSGNQTGDYDVEVRGGEVTRLVRNGRPLENRGSSWRSWTVPGMFEILEIDLGRIDRAADADPTAQYRVSVEFDVEWGFPRRYRQIQLGGNGGSSEWQITEFSPKPQP